MTITADIENFDKKISKPVKRVAPSASDVSENLFDFILDLSPESIPETEIDNLYQLLGDLEYLHTVELNEGLHFAKKSTTGARIAGRKWYQKNRGRVKKLQMRLKKSKGLQKKKAIMGKSDRGLTGRKKKKYHTNDHVNDAAYNFGFDQYIKENKIGENSQPGLEYRLRQSIKETVDKWFEPERYRVIREFTIGETEALLNESFEYFAGTWLLNKHNGEVWKFKGLEKKDIEKFIMEDK